MPKEIARNLHVRNHFTRNLVAGPPKIKKFLKLQINLLSADQKQASLLVLGFLVILFSIYKFYIRIDLSRPYSNSFILYMSNEALLKKRLWYRCFPVNFAKFLRTPFYRTRPDYCF